MSALAFARPPAGRGEREPQLFAVAATLDVAVSRHWDRLREGGAEPCLVCGGEVQARWSAGRGVVGGRCADCGTTLD